MAYYAAVISLKHTINRLLNSSQIFILPSSRKTIEFAYENIRSLQEILRKLESSSSSRNNSEMVESLREQIRDAAYKLEDAVESHISNQFLSQSESHGDEEIISLHLNEIVKQEINYFNNMVKQMKDECSRQGLELSNPFPEGDNEEDEEDDEDDEEDDEDVEEDDEDDEEDDEDVEEDDEDDEEDDEDVEEDDIDTLNIVFRGMESKMVGLSDLFSNIKETLLNGYFSNWVVSVSGMAGIGKTTLAKEIYQNPTIIKYFGCRMWVTVGQKCKLRKIMLDILAQLDHDINRIQVKGDTELGYYLQEDLASRRYLIVLDDVWNEKDWNKLQKHLPNDNGCRVLLTSRLNHIPSAFFNKFEMRFLNEEESWCLLREKVFGKEPCSFQFEKAGKKIAQKCDGLPLLIVTVADLLSKAERTVEYWNRVANQEDMSIFKEANDKISNILLRSYKHLPEYLKASFLYMGVFPSKCKIPASKLSNLWTAEDISESALYAKKHLSVLVSSNLVMADQAMSLGGTKTCSLHSSFWHACVKQSWKEKFLHVISSFADSSKEGVKSRRRLCIYNNVLFGIKEVYNSIASISGARSLMCSGPYHQYPVPICFGLRMLKVLDVLSVRFYKFPIEVLKLIHLRYLALTYNGKVPASISKLWNLEYFIVRRHLNIKFPGDCSYLPVEIWNLQKLRHLQVTGSCLPYLYDALLPHLLKLSDMSVHNCSKEILERIPNLQKLGIQIELAPDASEPVSCFHHLSHLKKLQSLKCVIVNPNPTNPRVVIPPTCITAFPSTLKKLSLSGFGYSWEYIHMIAKLPELQVLKLRSYAFRGPEWVVHEDDFQHLRILVLEDIDLMHLRSNHYCFPSLCRLIVRHCYKLKEIPLDLGFLIEIQLVDSPLVANYIQEIQQAGGSSHFSDVHVHSSWDVEEQKA